MLIDPATGEPWELGKPFPLKPRETFPPPISTPSGFILQDPEESDGPWPDEGFPGDVPRGGHTPAPSTGKAGSPPAQPTSPPSPPDEWYGPPIPDSPQIAPQPKLPAPPDPSPPPAPNPSPGIPGLEDVLPTPPISPTLPTAIPGLEDLSPQLPPISAPPSVPSPPPPAIAPRSRPFPNTDSPGSTDLAPAMPTQPDGTESNHTGDRTPAVPATRPAKPTAQIPSTDTRSSESTGSPAPASGLPSPRTGSPAAPTSPTPNQTPGAPPGEAAPARNRPVTEAERHANAREYRRLQKYYENQAHKYFLMRYDHYVSGREQDAAPALEAQARKTAEDMGHRADILSTRNETNYRKAMLDAYNFMGWGMHGPEENDIAAFFAQQFNDQATLNWLKLQHPANLEPFDPYGIASLLLMIGPHLPGQGAVPPFGEGPAPRTTGSIAKPDPGWSKIAKEQRGQLIETRDGRRGVLTAVGDQKVAFQNAATGKPDVARLSDVRRAAEGGGTSESSRDVRSLGAGGDDLPSARSTAGTLRTTYYTQPLDPVTPPEPGKGILEEPHRATVDEAKVINERLENGTVYRPDGSVVIRKPGQYRDRIEFTDEEQALLEDTTVTHNHPCGNSFSLGDLKFAAEKNLRELRIVCPKPDGGSVLFRLQRPANGWPRVEDLAQAFGDARSAVRNRQYNEINAQKISKKKASQTFADEIMKELQAQRPNSITYSRIDL